MRIYIPIMCIIMNFSLLLGVEKFYSVSSNITGEEKKRILGCSWKKESPVALQDLRIITLKHWGYDGKTHMGRLVVHKLLAKEIQEIFKEIFEAKFPIERMDIIDMYDANDELSMTANNTSAFCFRANTTRPGVYSDHSYGVAIDINPLVNPYIRGDVVLPVAGKAYGDRSKVYKGMITASTENPCYKAFILRGYEWGGHWKNLKDYQHFSKNPEKLGIT